MQNQRRNPYKVMYDNGLEYQENDTPKKLSKEAKGLISDYLLNRWIPLISLAIAASVTALVLSILVYTAHGHEMTCDGAMNQTSIVCFGDKTKEHKQLIDLMITAFPTAEFDGIIEDMEDRGELRKSTKCVMGVINCAYICT